MGNCIETYQDHAEEKKHQEEGSVKRNDDDKDKGKNGVSMKVVLTKEELKWLIVQLNEKGGMRVEEMLAGIERGRSEEKVQVEGWKPSLESILEAPEMLELEMDTA